MKKILSTGMAATLALANLGASFAATPQPRIEPENGFTTGRNPEWSEKHIDQEPNAPHRAYHQKMELEHRVWLSENSSSRGTEQYNARYREFRSALNAAHRAYHAGTLTTPMPQPIGGPAVEPATSNEDSSTRVNRSPAVENLQGRGRPSRRSVVENAESRTQNQAASFPRPTPYTPPADEMNP